MKTMEPFLKNVYKHIEFTQAHTNTMFHIIFRRAYKETITKEKIKKSFGKA